MDITVKENTAFYNIRQEPFKIYGVFFDEGCFRRLPKTVAESVSGSVAHLACNTAGGRVRFRTDSPYVSVSAKMWAVGKMAHFPLTGSAGFDIYSDNGEGEVFEGTFIPPWDIEGGYEARVDLGERRSRDITVNFPLYSGVNEVSIGIDKDCGISAAADRYRFDKPIVFYGSSITQGGVASRPGNAYTAITSRRLCCDHINLGFSGSARGESEIAEYIAGLDMKAFVYDYDHNAPNADHLAATHKPMFDRIREKNPDLPIVMMSTTTMDKIIKERDRRREIILDTYNSALAAGDKNVYFIDGSEIFKTDDGSTVEGCHPTDGGFLHMADALTPILKKILGI